MSSRREITNTVMAMSVEDRLAAIIVTTCEQEPEQLGVVCGMLAVLAVFARALPSSSVQWMVNGLRKLADEIEEPLLIEGQELIPSRWRDVLFRP